MNKNKVYIETYGYQMNLDDTEIVLGILQNNGYGVTKHLEDAVVVLVNTCSIRENAEQRIYGRLGNFKTIKDQKPDLVVGVLGCMAERLRTHLVDIGAFDRFGGAIGLIVFGLLQATTGSSRPAILLLIVFFGLGACLLSHVDVERGRRLARQSEAAAHDAGTG